MKRMLSLVMALVLVLSLGTVAFADDTTDTSSWVSDATSAAITLKKVYTVTGAGENPTLYPAETLKFAVAAGTSNPDSTLITVDDLAVAGNSDQTIKINLPSYSKVGVYEYTITENAGSTQGVTYTGDSISVKVLVTYNYTDSKLDAEVVLNTPDGNSGKVDTFTNKYDVGALSVKKEIDGNLASRDAYFEMTVVFVSTGAVKSDISVSATSDTNNPTSVAASAWTAVAEGTGYTVNANFKLKADETITFSDIPAGVTYTVTEAAKHLLADGETLDPNSAADEDYTVTYTDNSGTIASNATSAAVVKNVKSTSISTGISMDTLPYVLLLAVACVGIIALVSKKRLAREH